MNKRDMPALQRTTACSHRQDTGFNLSPVSFLLIVNYYAAGEFVPVFS